MQKRFLSIILLLALIFSCFAVISCDKQTDDNGESDTAFVFCPDKTYHIVYSVEQSKVSDIKDAVAQLKTALSQRCGIDAVETCDADDSGNANSFDYEILIGFTNREVSGRLTDGLKMGDYTYLIESENQIAICGGSASAVKLGVEKFCSEFLAYADGVSETIDEIKLDIGTTYTFKEDYDYDKLFFEGVDASDCVVVYSKNINKSYADNLAKELSSYAGDVIESVHYGKVEESKKLMFCFGSDGKALKDYSGKIALGGADGCVVKKYKEDSGVRVELIASNAEQYGVAVDLLKGAISVEKADKEVRMTLADEPMVRMKGVNSWTLESQNDKNVSDGVTYSERLYKDEQGNPYNVFILKVDLKKNFLYMGTADDSYQITPAAKATVTEQMRSASKKSNINAIAGVNGDFFKIDTNNDPEGIAIKEGTVINPAVADRAYLGFTNSGEAVIGETNSLGVEDLAELKTAVGSSHVIVSGSTPNKLEMKDPWWNMAHPRTLSGICDDGSLLLVVIDGRSEISGGATLAEAAALMISLGANTATNHDGGGSSSMVVKVGNSYITRNDPSDGSLRQVYNSILVVPNN